MPAYLLGSQALIDSARNVDTPVHEWARAIDADEDDIVVSVASFTLFKHRVDRLEASDRAAWQRLFNIALARHKSYDGILPVTLDTALRAAELRAMALMAERDGEQFPLGDLGRLVAATALEEHLTLVDTRQPYHAVLESAHGLSFHDPYSA